MDVGNLSRCDMHKPHEGAHALTHSQAILAALSQSFVRTVGNAATWNWILYKAVRYPAREKKLNNYDFWRKHLASLHWTKTFLLDPKNKPQHKRVYEIWTWKDLILG